MKVLPRLIARVWLGAGLTAFFAISVALARAEGANPQINQPYLNPNIQQWVERFESEGRDIYDKRLAIVSASGVRRGMTVADIGAGTGLFTRLFAETVGPRGKVYAVDISKPFVDNILRMPRLKRQAPIIGIVNTQTDTLLPPDSIDLAFISDTYHHFEQPEPTMRSIHRALKRKGLLVVIDFKRDPGKSSAWVIEHVRGGKLETIAEIERIGFKLIEDRDFLRDNYFLKFKKIERTE